MPLSPLMVATFPEYALLRRSPRARSWLQAAFAPNGAPLPTVSVRGAPDGLRPEAIESAVSYSRTVRLPSAVWAGGAGGPPGPGSGGGVDGGGVDGGGGGGGGGDGGGSANGHCAAAAETGLGPVLFSYANAFIPVSSPPLGGEDADIVTLLVVADVTVDNLPVASAGTFCVPTESRAVYDRRSGEFLSITSRPLPRQPGEAGSGDGRGGADTYQLQWEYFQLGDCRSCKPTSGRCRTTVTSLLCSPSRGRAGGGGGSGVPGSGSGTTPSPSGSASGAPPPAPPPSSPAARGSSPFALLSRMDCLLQPAAPPPPIPNGGTPMPPAGAVDTPSHGVSAVVALTHALRGLFGVAIAPSLSWLEACGPLAKLPPSMSLVQEYVPAGPAASSRLRSLAARLFLPPFAYRPLGHHRDGPDRDGRIGGGGGFGGGGLGGGFDGRPGGGTSARADAGTGERRHVRVRRRKLDLKDVETEREKERILRNRAAAMRSNAKRRDARIAKAAAKMAAAAREREGGGVGGGVFGGGAGGRDLA